MELVLGYWEELKLQFDEKFPNFEIPEIDFENVWLQWNPFSVRVDYTEED